MATEVAHDDTKSVASLRQALANSDSATVETQIRVLLTPEKFSLLGDRDYVDISSFLRHFPETGRLVDPTSLVILSLRAHKDFLSFVMCGALQDQRPENVIRMWQFLHALLVDVPSQHQLPSASTSGSSVSLHSYLERPKVLRNLRRPMAYAVLAFAQSGESVPAVLQNFLRLPPIVTSAPSDLNYIVKEYMKNTPADDPKLLLAHQYLELIQVVQLLERPQRAMGFFEDKLKSRDIASVLRTIETMIKWAKASPPIIAPIDSPSWGTGEACVVRMTEPMWSVVIAGLAKAGHLEDAKAVWDSMAQLKVPRTTITWNALLAGYGARRRSQEILRIWGAMDGAGVSKDPISYTTAISGLFKSKAPDQALELFSEFKELAKTHKFSIRSPASSRDGNDSANDAHPSSSSPPTETYNAVLHGLLTSYRNKHADLLFNDMCTEGPQPDITTFNTFIRHYDRRGDLKSIAALLRRLPELKIRPDVFTFTSVLHALMRSNVSMHEAIKRVESAMLATGVEPNVVMYTAIINQTIRQGGQDNVTAALVWLDAMRLRGLRPNEVTYTAMLAAIQKDEALGGEFAGATRSKIVSQMLAEPAHKNRVTYNVLIKAKLTDPGEAGLKKALELYDEMVVHKVRATDDTWYLLLHGALERRAFKLGQKILERMDAVGFIPQGRVARLAVEMGDHASGTESELDN